MEKNPHKAISVHKNQESTAQKAGLSQSCQLPYQLKCSIEYLSGYAMDDVKVHYNSDKPAKVRAHAYAKGLNIYLASGQEKYLAHETWHVVQQKQGRVQATQSLNADTHINDSIALEIEADAMGALAEKMVLDLPEQCKRVLMNSNINDLEVPIQRKFEGQLLEGLTNDQIKKQIRDSYGDSYRGIPIDSIDGLLNTLRGVDETYFNIFTIMAGVENLAKEDHSSYWRVDGASAAETERINGLFQRLGRNQFGAKLAQVARELAIKHQNPLILNYDTKGNRSEGKQFRISGKLHRVYLPGIAKH